MMRSELDFVATHIRYSFLHVFFCLFFNALSYDHVLGNVISLNRVNNMFLVLKDYLICIGHQIEKLLVFSTLLF